MDLGRFESCKPRYTFNIESMMVVTTMYHHTKTKGDLAQAKIQLDLIEKGYEVYTSTSEHSRADLVVVAPDGSVKKIQCKYSIDGNCRAITTWSDKNGIHTKPYLKTDFDYYALYIPSIDRVVYPSNNFMGCTIQTVRPTNKGVEYYWWEDFVNFTDTANKIKYTSIQENIPSLDELKKISVTDLAKQYNLSHRTIRNIKKEKGLMPPTKNIICKKCNNICKANYCKYCNPKVKGPKIIWPSKEELEKLVWEKSTSLIAKELGISDKAIEKHCKKLGIVKPSRGYWAKQNSQNRNDN